MPLNVYLAAHLELFQMMFVDIESKLDILAEDFRAVESKSDDKRDVEIIRADSHSVYEGFMLAAKHAECAERILVTRVLSKYPTLHGFRSILFPTPLEKECKCRLISK